MEDTILEFCQKDHVSFMELHNTFPGLFGGETALCFPDFPTLIVWQGFTQEGADVLLNVLNGRRLFLYPCPTLIYAIDGGGLSLPVAKRIRHYRHPHWLPMVLCLHPPEVSQQSRQGTKVKRRSGGNGRGAHRIARRRMRRV